jgi:hypothetical protein
MTILWRMDFPQRLSMSPGSNLTFPPHNMHSMLSNFSLRLLYSTWTLSRYGLQVTVTCQHEPLIPSDASSHVTKLSA